MNGPDRRAGAGVCSDLIEEVACALRHARDQKRLDQIPLVSIIRDHYRQADAIQAMRLVVDDALRGDNECMETLRKLVVRCYLTGDLTQMGTAKDLAISKRHFQTLRDEAVARIARHLAKMLDATPDLVQLNRDLDRLARALAGHDPKCAHRVYSTIGPKLSVAQQRDWLRARVDAGEELTEDACLDCPELSRTAVLALVARSQIQVGKKSAAASLLTEVHRTSGKLDDLTLFEVGQCSFIVARESANARGMKTASLGLQGLAAKHEEYVTASRISKTETHIHTGNVQEAARGLHILQGDKSLQADAHALAVCVGLRAQYEFSQNRCSTALKLASAAEAALTHRPFERAQCHVTSTRARLLSGLELDRKANGALPSGWASAMLAALGARSLLRGGDTKASLDSALRVGAIASKNEYSGIYAHALATAGACYDALHHEEAAQRAYLDALAIIAASADRLASFDLCLALDLPQREIGPLQIDGAFVESTYDVIASVVPQIKCDTTDQQGLVRRCARAMLDMVADEARSWIAFEESVEQLSLSSCALAHYAASSKNDLIDVLHAFISPVLDLEVRLATRQRITTIVHTLAELASPTLKRQYLIG